MAQQLALFPLANWLLKRRLYSLWIAIRCLVAGLGATCAAQAQCPVAACLPGSAPAPPFVTGILRVQVADLDTTTRGSTDGYQDYSCVKGATLTRGTTYRLQVTTNPTADETVRAWVDFNGDGIFSLVSEQVLASQGRQHSGYFTVPLSASSGAVLRMRIAADLSFAPIPGPCTRPAYSQTEDYRVRIAATAPPRPQAAFTADTVSCSGLVPFRDGSRNAPTSWRWSFGDGQSSTLPNPTHQYAAPGTYTVRLRACNAAGCDSLTKPAYVLVLADVPRPAACQPATAAYCCQFGLARVQLAGLDHAPGGGAAGYVDASCAHRATLRVDRRDTLRLTTGQASAQDIRLYLDLNDDGQLNPVTELIYTALAVRNPDIIFQILSSTPGLVYQRPLRLRLWADYAGSPAGGPCTPPQLGQVVDYSVVLQPNTLPPRAAFSLSYTRFCGPVQVALTNTSVGATSYSWDFGDGTTVSGANPAPHTYATPNVYELRLIAHNPVGSDTVRQTVVVAGPCPTYCPASGGGNPVRNEVYFTRVQLGSLDNRINRGPGDGYRDYTAQTVDLVQGQTYSVRTESPPWSFAGTGPWVRMTTWIDYNQDGVFSIAERIGPVRGLSPHQTSFRVPLGARPGATRVRVQLISVQAYDLYNSCADANQAAFTEDYTAFILPAPLPPVAGFTIDQAVSCTGMVQLRDTSSVAPTQWYWDFGDGGTSAAQHPLHTYTLPGTYAINLTVSNRYGTSTVSRTAAITITQLGSAPRPAACLPPDGPSLATTMGAGNVDLIQIGPWSYANALPNRFVPYRDETCLPPATLFAGNPESFALHSLNTSGMRVKVWLDANDDGVFDPTGELLYTTPAVASVSNPRRGNLTPPSIASQNRPLRLRVWWMGDFNTTVVWVDGEPCFRSQQWGQVRDFAVVVTSGTGTPAQVQPAGSLPGWSLYPNPSSGAFFVHAPALGSRVLTIHDLLGRAVHTQLLLPSDSPQAVQVGQLAPGLYSVQLAGSGPAKRVLIQ